MPPLLLPQNEKAYIFQMLRRLRDAVKLNRKQRAAMTKILLKFTPGTEKLSLTEGERDLIVGLLLKLQRLLTNKTQCKKEFERLGQAANSLLNAPNHSSSRKPKRHPKPDETT